MEKGQKNNFKKVAKIDFSYQVKFHTKWSRVKAAVIDQFFCSLNFNFIDQIIFNFIDDFVDVLRKKKTKISRILTRKADKRY